MRRNALGGLVAAAGVVLACACFTIPAQAVEVNSADSFMSALSGTEETITLTGDVTLDQGVTITRDVTIDGAGHTLKNENDSTVSGVENALNVSGKGVNVTIKNLTIVDAHTGNVLTALEGSQVSLQGVTLDHTQSSDGAALIVNDGSNVTMSGCTIKLGSGSWGGVAMEGKGSTVDLGTPSVSGDAGKALVYVDGDTSANISDYVDDVTGPYIVSPITDDQNKPALVSSEWTVTNQAEFQLALDNAPDGMLIRLGNDIEVTGNGLYAANKKDIILEGNNHTITASDLVAGSHGGADRAALTFANCVNTSVSNLKVVSESGTNNNGLNFWGGSATTGNITLTHSANGGAPMIVAAGANVTVTGDISATIGAGSWGIVNVDVKGGTSKLTFDETVHAIFDTTANPDAPAVYIDEDNNTPLAGVVSGLDNAGLYLDSNGSAIEAPVVTFNLDGQVLTAVRVSSDGTLNMAAVNEALEAQRPAHKVFDGWYTDKDFKTEFDPNKPVTADVTVYGRWVVDGSQIIEITFLNGSEVHAMAQLYRGETLAGVEVPDPVWAGHTFVGWYAEVNEDGTVVESSKVDLEKDVFNASTTLHAGFVTAGGSTPTSPDSTEKPAGLAKTSDPTAVAPLVASAAAGIAAAAGAVALRRRSK